jgi:mannose-6-phosphate isomerase-like protein (cupin superfamily)
MQRIAAAGGEVPLPPERMGRTDGDRRREARDRPTTEARPVGAVDPARVAPVSADRVASRSGVWRRIEGPQRPDWSRITSAGTTEIRVGSTQQRHFHDCDEYWLVFEGRAVVFVDGEIHRIGPGDMVCTETGKVHDILAVDEVLRMFWFEQEVFPGGIPGHRFETEEQRLGHPVVSLADWRDGDRG